MITDLLRPLLRVLFWTRWRPWIALAVIAVTLAVAGRVAGCGGPRPATPVPPPATFTPAATAQATPPPPAAALAAARAFLAAWISRGPGRDAAIRATATPQLCALLAGPGGTLEPATAVTGPVQPTAQAPGRVSVSAATNAGPALVTLTLSGGRWLAAQVALARQGD